MPISHTSWLGVGDGEQVMLTEFGEGQPVCTFIAGVHGDEREGVVALTRLSRDLAGQDLEGTVRLVPVANPPAYHAHSRTSPRDGLNLARVFPGNPHGSVSERIAATLSELVIAGSDILVDLHSAGSQWLMPFFAGFVSVAPDLDEIALGACAAFGSNLVWRHEVGARGRSLSVARDLDIPAMYVETGGGNRILESDLIAYVEGCRAVLGFMGAIETDGEDDQSGIKVVPGGHGDLDSAIAAPASGHLVAVREPGDMVSSGDALFRIIPELGDDLVDVAAQEDGVIMAMRRSTSVLEGDELAIVAPNPNPLGGEQG